MYLIMDTWEGKDQAHATKPLNKRPFNSAGRRNKPRGSRMKDPKTRGRGKELMCTQAGPGPALHRSCPQERTCHTRLSYGSLGMVWALLPTHSRVPSCRDCVCPAHCPTQDLQASLRLPNPSVEMDCGTKCQGMMGR